MVMAADVDSVNPHRLLLLKANRSIGGVQDRVDQLLAVLRRNKNAVGVAADPVQTREAPQVRLAGDEGGDGFLLSGQ